MINDGVAFSDQLGKYNIGEKVTLTIIRKRVFRKVEVTLKVFPVDAAKIYPQKNQACYRYRNHRKIRLNK